MQLTGLTAAAFTPLNNDATLDIDRIPSLVEHLLRDGVSALYVLGSTGEGISLTIHERQQTATAFVKAAASRVPVVVHVGHNCLQEAQTLAMHAQQIGASAISAVPPCYFRPRVYKVAGRLSGDNYRGALLTSPSITIIFPQRLG